MKKNSGQYKGEIIEVFSKISGNKELMFEFLRDILTPAEFDEVSLRWQIVKKLHKGEKHRDIAGDLGLGISTVTRGSRELRNKNGGFALVLKKFFK
jgi:TrpR family trp operon transcriptional repressor